MAKQRRKEPAPAAPEQSPQRKGAKARPEAPLPAAPEQPRRHRRRRQREAQIERRVLIGVGLAVGAAVILVLVGLVNELALKPRQVIAQVNGEAITVAEFQRRMRYEQDQLADQIQQYIEFGAQFAADGQNPFLSFIEQLFDDLATPERFSLTVLDEMTGERLVRQLAVSYDVTASNEELEREIEQQFGYDRDAPPPPTPDPAAAVTETLPSAGTTLEDYQQRYREVIDAFSSRNSLTETEFRELIRTSLLRTRLSEAAPLEFETTEEQVRARHILVRIATAGEDEEEIDPTVAEANALGEIQEARQRIVDGEDFALVAAEVSEDASNAEEGGDLGWFGRDRMVAEFAEVAFSLPPGELSQPVKTAFGYHLILVEEYDPARPLDESVLSQRRNDAFNTWFTGQRAAADIQSMWSLDYVPALPADLRNVIDNLRQLLIS
jgi:parvulin-like peptidyl-prolyl isomerase